MQYTHKQFGFTLIEVMVAVSIFTIVVTVGIGSLMTVNKGYRQSQLQRTAIDNIAFAMESMAREIRIGTNYTIDGFITNPLDLENEEAAKFAFLSFDIDNNEVIDEEDEVIYLLSQGTIEMYVNNILVGKLTSEDVTVTGLEFILEEQYGNDSKQPYVTIHISAVASGSNQESSILLQTGVSQRLVNSLTI